MAAAAAVQCLLLLPQLRKTAVMSHHVKLQLHCFLWEELMILRQLLLLPMRYSQRKVGSQLVP
jgi:hypothetical protein